MDFGSTRPLTPVQRGMVFHHLVDPRSGVDIEQLVTHTGPVDASRLGQAWQALVARHPTLRRHPVPTGSGDYRLALVDAGAAPLETVHGTRLAEWLAADRARGFDLLQAPPVRLTLLTTDERCHVVLTVHHLLLDGRSFPLLLVDLWEAYDALGDGRTPDIPARADVCGGVDPVARIGTDEGLAYWRELLDALPAATPFPEDLAPAGSPAWQRIDHRIEGERATALAHGLRRQSVGAHLLVQAAWATALARRIDAEAVVFGVVRAGRGPAGDAAHQGLGTCIATVPVLGRIGPRSGGALLADLAAQHRSARAHERVSLAALQGALSWAGGDPLFRTLLVYDREDLDTAVHRLRPAWTDRLFELHERTPYPVTLYAYGEDPLLLSLAFDARALAPDDARRLLQRVARIAEAIAADPAQPLRSIDLLLPDERALVARVGRGPSVAIEAATVVEQFERAADRHAQRTAVVAGALRLSYGELAVRVDAWARRIAAAGGGAGTVVGLGLDRSLELPVAMLAILRAGAAYLPLDPRYPPERIAGCLRDSGAALVVTQRRHAARFAALGVRVLEVDAPDDPAASPPALPGGQAGLQDRAYLIYTSGSTGTPKGVEVTHANVANFFAGMDAVLRRDASSEGERRWLAVTSPSFDISVLELLWTLCRGFEVVIHAARADTDGATGRPAPRFSLFHFASGFEAEAGDPYHLIRTAARFADDHGFEAVWSPERHFHAFGAPYPSPAVMNAALATMTQRVKLRAGSVVLPLHDTFRVAEDWALVDRLSGGRAGLSIASGWQPDDFVLAPQHYERRHERMFEQLEALRTLWRGGRITTRNPRGDAVSLGTYPRPLQPELPVWITAAGSPETFARAGACGANILTHLLGQSIDELRAHIDLWRRARAEAGHDPATGCATVMVHTFLGDDTEQVREQVREPMTRYLRSAASLVGRYADAWTAFKQGAGTAVDGRALDRLSPQEQEALHAFAFERIFETSGLFGTPERALAMVEALQQAGVDEIACLIDFGVDTDTVIAHLPWIDRLRAAAAERAARRLPAPDDPGVDEDDLVRDIRTHRITHLQCTPSLARTIPLRAGAAERLDSLQALLVGGEALPPDLAGALHDCLPPDARLLNMYGPTETTVWSTLAEVTRGAAAIPIGTAIANTGCHVVDSHRQPVPPGQPGELLITGAGVTQGYHRRPDLTASRFVNLPAAPDAGRAYATGDLVRLDADGCLWYLGRTDLQIKVRGHRIEPGEIEAHLRRLPGVRDAVVVARDDALGTRQLVAYVAAGSDAGRPDPAALRDGLRTVLPEHLVPDACVVLDALPSTPNGKVDRRALPDPHPRRAPAADSLPPRSEAERRIHDIWCAVLGLPSVGRDDNFFELGGHSILAVKLQAELEQAFGRRLPIVELFRAPTLAALAARFDDPAASADTPARRGLDRAQQRRAALSRRSGAAAGLPR